MVAGVGPGKAYDTSDKDYGIVPMPGIISFSVKNKNRGSIREANIKIKANSKRQFEIIDEIYLRLGYDMIIEWGWNQYVHNGKVERMGTTIIEEQWFGKEDVDYLYWLPELEMMRKRYHGNYDGFYGKVSNFKWNFEKDGSYSIDIKLISHGDVIESLRTVPPHNAFGGGSRMAIDKYMATVFADPNICLYTDKEAPGMSFSLEPRIGEDGKETDTDFPYELKLTEVKDRISEYIFNLSLIAYGLNTESINKQKSLSLWKVIAGAAAVALITFATGGTGLILLLGAGAAGGLVTATTDWAYNEESVRMVIKDKYEKGKGKKWSTILNNADNGYQTQPITFGNGPKIGRYVGQTFIGGKNPLFLNSTKTPYEEQINHDAFFLWYAPKDSDPDDSKTTAFDPRDMTAYTRFGHLLETINNSGVAHNKETGNGICHILTDVIPMYIPPHDKHLTLSYRPSRFILHNPSHKFNILKEEFDSDGNSKPIIVDVTSNPMLHAKNAYYGLNKAIKEGAGVPYLDARNIYISNSYIFDKIPITSNDNNETKIDLHGFLKSICTDINEALGSINNLEPIIDELTNDVRITDSTNYPGKKKLLNYLNLPVPNDDEEARFQIFGYRGSGTKTYAGFVRDAGISTKITKEIAAMITIGATAKGSSPNIDATAFSRFNAGKINRFAKTFVAKTPKKTPKERKEEAIAEMLRSSINRTIHEGGSAEDLQKEREELNKYCKKNGIKSPELNLTFTEKFLLSLGEKPAAAYGFDEMADGFFTKDSNADAMNKPVTGKERATDTINPFDAGAVDNPFTPLMREDSSLEGKNVRTMATLYSQMEAIRYKQAKSGSPSVGFIPFEMSLTLDGISGIKIYSGIRTNTEFLPHNSPETLEFITKGVDHDISGNDWTTKITTIACPKTIEELPEITNKTNIGSDSAGSGAYRKPPGSGESGDLSNVDSVSSQTIEEAQIKDDAATYDRLRASIIEGDFYYAGKASTTKKVQEVKGIWDDEGPNLIAIRNNSKNSAGQVISETFTNKHEDILIIAYKLNGEKRVYYCTGSTNPGLAKDSSFNRWYFPQQTKDYCRIDQFLRIKDKKVIGTNGVAMIFGVYGGDNYIYQSVESVSKVKVGKDFNYKSPNKPRHSRGMHIHHGYGNALSRNTIGPYSKGCFNFQNYQGQAGWFQTLHKITQGSKMLGNQGATFVCNKTILSKGRTPWARKSGNQPWGKFSNAKDQYNCHMMLLSQLKKPSTPTPTPAPAPAPNPADNMNINKAI